MESLDLIEKVSMSTPWVSSMVIIVKPNGTLQLFIDSCDLIDMNITRCRKPYAAIFSVLDTSSADKAGPRECQTLHFQQSIWKIHVVEIAIWVIVGPRYLSNSNVTNV